MAYGFQFFDALGDKFLDTNNFAWSVLDSFRVDRLQAMTGNKSYNDLPSGTTLIATFDPVSSTNNWVGFSRLDVVATGNTVQWVWVVDNTAHIAAGYSVTLPSFPFDEAVITVFVR